MFRQAEILLEQEDTTKYRGVYFLEFHPETKLDHLEAQQENIINIYKSIKKNKPMGCVKSIRKSFHRRNVFITHEYSMSLFDELCSEKILELIEKKNEKFPYYDTSVDECWLVIVSDMNSIASRYTFIQDKEHLTEVKSPFHKIFHLENLCGNITSIK
jgi:fructose-1,6-bisphosphatase